MRASRLSPRRLAQSAISPPIVAWGRAQRCRRERPRSCIAVGCVGTGLRPVPAEYRSAGKLLLAAFSARNEVVPFQSGTRKHKSRYTVSVFRYTYFFNFVVNV